VANDSHSAEATNDPVMIAMLEKSGGLRRGHFQIDRIHTDLYFDKHKLLLTPRWATRVYRRLAERVQFLEPDLILGPLTSGVLIAYDLARYLLCDCIYFDLRHSDSGIADYWKGYDLSRYARVLIADDIVVTGRTIEALRGECQRAALAVVGAATLIQYPSFGKSLGVPHVTLAPSLFSMFDVSSCPMCAAGKPVEILR
jgi:orotate phosphoribosyltransferase